MEINLSEKQKTIILLSLGGVLLFLITIIIVLMVGKSNKTSTDSDNTLSPSPEPTVGFTGYTDVTVSPEIKQEIDQNRALRNKSPYTDEGFRIEYNYDTFKFDVFLSEPYTSSQNNFESFINNTYPGIPEEKFTIVQE